MNWEMVNHLVRKEWHFSKPAFVLLLGAGITLLIALSIAATTDISILRIILLILFFAVFNFLFWLPVATVLSERTDQTLAFLVSLPITIKEYSAAKIIANFGIMLVVWLLLSGGMIGRILVFDTMPTAYLPLMMLVLLQVIVLFCLMMSVALVTESRPWTMVAGIVGNVLFWFSFSLIPIAPGLGIVQDPVEAWDAVSWMMPSQLVAIALILGLAIFFQSRKTDFLR